MGDHQEWAEVLVLQGLEMEQSLEEEEKAVVEVEEKGEEEKEEEVVGFSSPAALHSPLPKFTSFLQAQSS